MADYICIMNKKFKIKTLVIIGGIVAVIVVAAFMILLLNGRSNSSVSYEKSVSAEQVVADPGGYKGGKIKFIGKVFKAEGSDKSYVLQVYSDIKNSSGNIIVYSVEKFKEGDYVKVSGTIGEKFIGENAFGASLTLPTVSSNTIKSVDADEAVAPTVMEKTLNLSKVVGGLTVNLQKIEYAKNETRLFIHFDNGDSSKYSFYSFNANLVQDKKKINTVTDYGRITYDSDGDILANTIKDVKLYYAALDPKSSAAFSFQVTNDSDYNSTDIIFDINQ